MNHLFRILLPALLMTVFVTGCSPTYKLVDRYQPPIHESGLSCIRDCGQTERQCTSQCADKREDCEYYALEDAKVKYGYALEDYIRETERHSIDLHEYYADLREYEADMHHLQEELVIFNAQCTRGDEYGCKHAKKARKKIKRSWSPVEPLDPIRPKIEDFRYRAIASCDLPCGCKEPFNICYVTCGGQVTQDKICTSNCK